MAKVKYGAIVTDARGKVDGIVYSKNQYGGYIRSKVSGVQPRNNAAMLQRNNFSRLSTRFSNILTDAQRLGWAIFSENFPITDRFGNSQKLSPVAAYVMSNMNQERQGGTLNDDAPTNQNVISVTSMTVVFDIGLGDPAIEFEPDPLPADHVLVIKATPILPPGVQFFRPRLRDIGTTTFEVASPFDFESMWLARFGADPSVGDRIGFEIHVGNQDNGARAADLSFLVTVIESV